MADYTELEKQAQEIFAEMLAVCEKKIPNFSSYKIDPVLGIKNDIRFIGLCLSGKNNKDSIYDHKIYVSRKILPSPKRIIKETITHELAHVIATLRAGHGKEFKKAIQLIDGIFDTDSFELSNTDQMIIDEALFEFDKELYKKCDDYRKKQEEKRIERERKKQERIKQQNEEIRQWQIEHFGHDLGNIPKLD